MCTPHSTETSSYLSGQGSGLRRSSRLLLAAAALTTLMTLMTGMTSVALALPTSTLFDGVLMSTTGTPAADGDYSLTFRIFADAAAKTALWQEGPVKVKVTGGRFIHALGSLKALPATAIATAKAPQLSVQVGSDPALPAQPLHSVLVAHRAFGLACTGCVSVAQLKFDGDIDLGSYSFKAKNGTFTGALATKSLTADQVNANTVTATAFVGDGSKLSGLSLPKGSCPSGQVVVGIAGDGSLVCKSTAGSLPKDGLSTVSNGALSNQFVDVYTANVNKQPIPDNTGLEAASALNIPNTGIAQDFVLNVELQNTDLSKVSIIMLPPNDKKVGWVLCDPCGKLNEKQLKRSWTAKAPPQKGDLKQWIGANPAGSWTLKVKDTAFCVPQMAGNQLLCDTKNTTDGWVMGWNITVKTLASSKVQTTGGLVIGSGMQLGVLKSAPAACTAKTRGMMYIDDATDRLQICRKTGLWGTVVIHECGNKKIETGETCDDGNVKSGDGCDGSCQAECGNGQVDTGEECDFNDPKTKDKCSKVCKKIKFGALWLESNYYRWYPVPYPHAAYSESKAVAVCKSVGLRLWRDESGSKTDVNWAYDYNGGHNLGGHDICYKVNSATANNQQGHTGTWKSFATAWSNDIKSLTQSTNGTTVTILNHYHHTGSNETHASWCKVRPQATSVQWAGSSNGPISGLGGKAVVLCAQGK